MTGSLSLILQIMIHVQSMTENGVYQKCEQGVANSLLADFWMTFKSLNTSDFMRLPFDEKKSVRADVFQNLLRCSEKDSLEIFSKIMTGFSMKTCWGILSSSVTQHTIVCYLRTVYEDHRIVWVEKVPKMIMSNH